MYRQKKGLRQCTDKRRDCASVPTKEGTAPVYRQKKGLRQCTDKRRDCASVPTKEGTAPVYRQKKGLRQCTDKRRDCASVPTKEGTAPVYRQKKGLPQCTDKSRFNAVPTLLGQIWCWLSRKSQRSRVFSFIKIAINVTKIVGIELYFSMTFAFLEPSLPFQKKFYSAFFYPIFITQYQFFLFHLTLAFILSSKCRTTFSAMILFVLTLTAPLHISRSNSYIVFFNSLTLTSASSKLA